MASKGFALSDVFSRQPVLGKILKMYPVTEYMPKNFICNVLMKRNFSKILDLILEHDHGKVQAAKLPRIHSVRQWVNKIIIGKHLHFGQGIYS